MTTMRTITGHESRSMKILFWFSPRTSLVINSFTSKIYPDSYPLIWIIPSTSYSLFTVLTCTIKLCTRWFTALPFHAFMFPWKVHDLQGKKLLHCYFGISKWSIALDCKVGTHCRPTLRLGGISFSSTQREISSIVSYTKAQFNTIKTNRNLINSFFKIQKAQYSLLSITTYFNYTILSVMSWY